MIKAIIGLGNPGPQYFHTRHNIGFRVLDALAERYGALWKIRNNSEEAIIQIGGQRIKLIKPLTFMNESGKIVPDLLRKGIAPEEVLVVHDELELPFGKVAFKFDGSARGHNGLKSIISVYGSNFNRIRCGIGRPSEGEDVSRYVLHKFEDESKAMQLIADALDFILSVLDTDQQKK